MSKEKVDIYMTTHGVNAAYFEKLKADYPRLVIKDIKYLKADLTTDIVNRIREI